MPWKGIHSFGFHFFVGQLEMNIVCLMVCIFLFEKHATALFWIFIVLQTTSLEKFLLSLSWFGLVSVSLRHLDIWAIPGNKSAPVPSGWIGFIGVKLFFCLAFDWAITNHSTCLESLAEWNRSCLRISRYSPLASVLTSIPLVHSVCARYCIFFSVWEVKTLVLSNQRIFLRIFGNSPTPYFGELQCFFFLIYLFI